MAERAVITGIGAVSSLGESVAATWSALFAGRSAVGPSAGVNADGFDAQRAARVSGPDATVLGVDARSARIMGRPALMMLQAGREALAQANLATADPEPERRAFFAGMGMVDPEPDDLRRAVVRARGRDGIDYGRFFADAYREIYPLWPLAMLNNVGFCLVAQRLAARGENAVFSQGADAAMMALVEAAAAVVDQRADVALAGGASESVSARSVARARLAGAAGPSGAATLGEAGGVLVVEAEGRARSRGARPLGAVAGWGFAFGALLERAVTDAMDQAIERAGLEGGDIDAVLLAGDGGDDADAAERKAIAGLFKSDAEPVLLTSKPAFGHAGPGGAALDIVLAVMTVSTGEPPEVFRADAASQQQGAHERTDCSPPRLRHVLVNARSWGGHLASLVVAGAE